MLLHQSGFRTNIPTCFVHDETHQHIHRCGMRFFQTRKGLDANSRHSVTEVSECLKNSITKKKKSSSHKRRRFQFQIANQRLSEQNNMSKTKLGFGLVVDLLQVDG